VYRQYHPNGTVRLWNPRSHQPPAVVSDLAYVDGEVTYAAFSPDGQTLATGSASDNIQLFSLSFLYYQVDDNQPNGELSSPYLILRGPTGAVTSVAFSPDEHTVASGSADDSIRLWVLNGPRDPRFPTVTLQGQGVVHSVAFSPDGHTLASGSTDGTVRLWDLRTDQATLVLQGHTGEVTSVAFSPDGHTLASGSTDHTIRLWDLDPRSWQRRACTIAGRNLTQDEWRTYIGSSLHYERTCPQFPPGAGT
jgi:WD40 repeat protein